MNKNQIIFILILLLFVSCQKKEIKKTYEKPDYLAYDSTWNIDTLTHNDIYNADTISYHEFYSAEKYDINDIETIDDRKNVTRKDSVLIFKLKNGKKKQLVNSKKPYLKDYFYLREVPDANCWLVEGLHNDEHSYNFLISKNTGIETPIADLPIISPNKKYMVSFRVSCTDPSYLQFFKIENDSISEQWLKIFNWDFVPIDVRWQNDSTLCIEMDSICMKEHNSKYIKLPVGRYMK